MAAKLEDRVLDNGISVLNTEANQINICSVQPTTYAQATGAASLGSKVLGAGTTFSAPAVATPNGRKVASTAITDGAINVGGNASFWAVVDTVNARLLAAGPLASTVAVTSGDTFTLASFEIAIPNQ
jgi:hypothetical protein